jgi:hypothetical protein
MLFLSFQCYWGTLHHCWSLPGYLGSIQWSSASAYSWLSGPSSCGGFTSLQGTRKFIQRLHGSDLRGKTDFLNIMDILASLPVSPAFIELAMFCVCSGLRLQHLFSQVQVGTSVCFYLYMSKKSSRNNFKNSVIVRTRFLVHFWTTFVNLTTTIS